MNRRGWDDGGGITLQSGEAKLTGSSEVKRQLGNGPGI